MKEQNNSYDFLRLLLATFVLISHGYALKEWGYKDIEIYVGRQTNLGQIGIISFFALSGFLITKSYFLNRDIILFIISRILRIFPAFWVCLVITAFLLGPLIYLIDHQNVFTYPLSGNNNAFGYIVNNFFLRIHQINIRHLLENTSFKYLNISLWTLFQEFKYYILTLLMGISGLLDKKKVLLILYAVAYLLFLLNTLNKDISPITILTHFDNLLVAYLTGVIVFIFHNFFYRFKKILYTVIVVSLFSFTLLNIVNLILPLALGIFNLLFFASFRIIIKADYSYGLYLYAFPVQLLLFFNFHETDLVYLLLFSFVCSFLLAYFSYHAIEKPVRKLKYPLKIIIRKWFFTTIGSREDVSKERTQ